VAQLGSTVQEVWRSQALLTGKDHWTLHRWQLEVAKAVRTREKHRWWRCVQERPTLSTYAQLKGSAAGLSLERYLSAPHGGWNDLGRIGRRALTTIRCGHHELRCSTGGWEEIDEEDRWCLLCAQAAETEEHFLLDCPWRDNGRQSLFNAIDGMVTMARATKGDRNAFVMQQLSRKEQWRLLTGGTLNIVKGEELQRRVTARILVAIAQWTNDRREVMEQLRRELSA
jgi:hypothetical protein